MARLKVLPKAREAVLRLTQAPGKRKRASFALENQLFRMTASVDLLPTSRYLKTAALAALWTLTVSASFGFERYFKNYSVEDGIQSQVTAVLQDRRGYLWIATEGGGVSKFDGHSFETFTVEQGLAHNRVLTMLEDSQGRLWFGTLHGLSCLDDGRFDNFSTKSAASPEPVYALAEDRSGTVWAGTDSGLYRHDAGSMVLDTAYRDAFGAGITTLLAEGANDLWIGTDGAGLVHRQDGKLERLTADDSLLGQTVISLLRANDGALWIATDEGLALHDAAGIRAVSGESVPTNVRAFLETRDGTLWVATNGNGMCRLDGDAFACLSEDDGLSSNFVWSLLEDREGNIWIGTYRGGLDRYSGDRFVRLDSPGGLGRDVIRSILEDSAGNLWFGTFRQGAAKWDGSRLTRYTTEDGLISNFILTTFEDDSGNLWFGTFDGVSKFDGQRFTNFDTSNGLSDRVVRAITQDVDGHMLFGTNLGGIDHFDGRNVRNYTESDGLASNRVVAFAGGDDDSIWIGSFGGVTRLRDGGLESVPFPAFEDVMDLVDDGRGHLWIAAFGAGIARCEVEVPVLGSCERFTSAHGLMDDAVVALALDRGGDLWIGTEAGVSRLDVAQFEDDGVKVFHNYGADEGFVGIESIRRSIVAKDNGDVWFGTVAGAFRYRPDHDRENVTAPMTMLTDIRLYSEPIDWTERGDGARWPAELRLDYDENHITFDFIGVSLSAPSQVSYRFKLDGWDDEWSAPTTVRHATYRRLPSGPYRFDVIARNSDGVWNEAPASYAVIIAAPFWRTPGFFAISLALIALALYGFVKLRVRNLEEQRAVLRRAVEESTRALLEEKGKVERINHELEGRVMERTEELARSNRSLTEEIEQRERLEDELLNTRKLESLGILAGGIAHDFNNLLTTVLGNISLALHLRRDDDELPKVLAEAEKASFRARDLTHQLLTFSKGGEPVKRSVDVDDLVREATSFALRGSNVKSVIDVPSSLRSVQADPGQVSQVIHNLVLNAAQAMPKGGVVTVRCRNGSVSPSESALLEPGDFVVISVEDEGDGIAEENLRRIFDPYFTTRPDGVGLGLAGAYSIVKKHGGTIIVDSEIASGTTVRVYLPAENATPGAIEPPPTAEAESARPTTEKHVLVMDDDEGIRKFACTVLSEMGHRVELASDGDAALLAFRRASESEQGFDLVIMDLTIPAGKGGKQTVRELAKLEPEVKVIVSSGYSNDPVMANYRSFGFHDVLPKPFSISELTEVIERAFDESEERVSS